MRGVIAAATASLLLYAATFALLLDRPLSFGFLQAQIEAKLARGAAIPGPKLVILAGSNGPYSHRCEAIEPIMKMPCVNGGVAVGVALDYLFARWQPLLQPGDLVYLPMEEEQYVRPHAAAMLGPDAAIMLRHDRRTLAALPPERWAAALFSYDVRGAILALIETALVARGFDDPRAKVTGTTNAWGDHVGHTPALAAASAAILAATTPRHASATAIRAGDGSVVIARFIAWARAHGIEVIGGLPTGFADCPPSSATVATIASLYRDNGAGFLQLDNLSLYPRTAFFDTAEHLNEAAQIAHSRLVADALLRLQRHTRWPS